ncbi:hypothetical protein [Vibrio phage YC]|uniref:Uncharacterized protein n=1 Tax=Vibrio phage YC TaxID=2267403 RepID=A0A384ZS11_9CAUD|nr:hypothetical protein HWB64_gp051 [Vibrio phage YC]AXC34420.1 hypothetical protein [Vibrio phage YC]
MVVNDVPTATGGRRITMITTYKEKSAKYLIQAEADGITVLRLHPNKVTNKLEPREVDEGVYKYILKQLKRYVEHKEAYSGKSN